MTLKTFSSLLLFILCGLWLLGCQSPAPAEPTVGDSAVEVTLQPLADDRLCTGGFFPHYISHVTTNSYEPIDMYDSNGTGVAANDLNQDGLIDLVFANLAGENQIFWNKGDFRFEPVPFPHGSTRAVTTIDVDGDGLLDIVFTSRTGSLIYWQNTGEIGSNFPFEMTPLPGVREQAYAMQWGDLDRDGDLDLVTGSYDTALEKELRDSFMMGDGAGVFVFENIDGEFVTQARLTDASQVLAIALMDINLDGKDDILIGNDFDSRRDDYWLATDAGWEAAEPFASTTQNTMSFDLGDVNNDGVEELFAADMHPYAFDDETNAAWGPVMGTMMTGDAMPNDPQIMENVLQTRSETGGFENTAMESGIAYSGWSWSSRFGDLDQDGFLDLYIVNGMITADTFGHLPNYELVEENQAFRNIGNGQFEPSPEWNLGATEGGRGMTMADLDGDGDLDIIINNLLAEAIVYENRICRGESLLIDLYDGRDGIQNRFGIGSRVTIETSAGVQTRQVVAAAGYLSAPPTQVHFGLPNQVIINRLTIEWVDGEITTVEGIQPNVQYSIKR